MPVENKKIDNTEKVLSMAEGPEKRFAIFQSMKERPRIPIGKRIHSIRDDLEVNLKNSIDGCSFVTIRDITKQRYSLEALMKALGVEMSKVYSTSWIGLSLPRL